MIFEHRLLLQIALRSFAISLIAQRNKNVATCPPRAPPKPQFCRPGSCTKAPAFLSWPWFIRQGSSFSAPVLAHLPKLCVSRQSPSFSAPVLAHLPKLCVSRQSPSFSAPVLAHLPKLCVSRQGPSSCAVAPRPGFGPVLSALGLPRPALRPAAWSIKRSVFEPTAPHLVSG